MLPNPICDKLSNYSMHKFYSSLFLIKLKIICFCRYCGEKVVTSGNNEQTHIKMKHPHLAFSCAPCMGDGDRYFYYDVKHVLLHLKHKHHFKENERDKKIIYPGTANSS